MTPLDLLFTIVAGIALVVLSGLLVSLIAALIILRRVAGASKEIENMGPKL